MIGLFKTRSHKPHGSTLKYSHLIPITLLAFYKHFTITQRWRKVNDGTSRYVTMPSVYVAGFIILTMVTGFVAIKAIPSGFAT